MCQTVCLGDERQKHFPVSSHPPLDKIGFLDINCPALLNVLQAPENVLHSGRQRDLNTVSGWDITQGEVLLDCINKPELVEGPGDGHLPAAEVRVRGWAGSSVRWAGGLSETPLSFLILDSLKLLM